MQNLKDIQNTNLIFGDWSGQLPNLNRSYLVQNHTFKSIMAALSAGKKVYVGNYPKRKNAEIISHVNSRYHGRSIRTIHVIN